MRASLPARPALFSSHHSCRHTRSPSTPARQGAGILQTQHFFKGFFFIPGLSGNTGFNCASLNLLKLLFHLFGTRQHPSSRALFYFLFCLCEGAHGTQSCEKWVRCRQLRVGLVGQLLVLRGFSNVTLEKNHINNNKNNKRRTK